MVLWAAMMVGMLRGFSSCQDLWRLVSKRGLWFFPRIDVSDMAIYHRLERTTPEAIQAFFMTLTRLLHERTGGQSAVSLAAFATEIYAVDLTVLDAMLRHLKVLRNVPKGAHQLLAGCLACVFDVRRQQWCKVEYRENPMENEKLCAPGLVADLPRGSLILADLGYFSFAWFDYLQERGHHFVSRLRQKVSFEVVQELYRGGNALVRLVEQVVYLGGGSCRAAFPVRLIEVTRKGKGGQPDTIRRYITDILDPGVLPAWEAVSLYGYRWDIESAFKLVKGRLGLHLLWSAHRNAVLHQVYACLLLSQMVLAFRFEIARRAQVDVREVSLDLMLRWLPQLAADGVDPVAEFVRMGRAAGFIRPFRNTRYEVPHVSPDAYESPPSSIPLRPPRYRRDGGEWMTDLERKLRARADQGCNVECVRG